MWRWLFIGFLLAHGFVHIAVWAMPQNPKQAAPFDARHSWMLGDAREVALSLAVAIGALYAVAAIGLLAHSDWWRPITVAASVASVLLMTLYFNPWLVVGWGLSAGLIVAILWLAWPSKGVLGA